MVMYCTIDQDGNKHNRLFNCYCLSLVVLDQVTVTGLQCKIKKSQESLCDCFIIGHLFGLHFIL